MVPSPLPAGGGALVAGEASVARVGVLRNADKVQVVSRANSGQVARVGRTASGKRVGDFTPSQKKKAKAENAAKNGGTMACTDCAWEVKNIKNQKGVRTLNNQAQVHHDPPLKDGGSRSSTPVVLCPSCHKVRHQ
jgi:hypothetical protein